MIYDSWDQEDVIWVGCFREDDELNLTYGTILENIYISTDKYWAIFSCPHILNTRSVDLSLHLRSQKMHEIINLGNFMKILLKRHVLGCIN